MTKDPVVIREILKKTVRTMGFEKKLNENNAILAWEEVVGKEVANKSRAIKIISGTLFVKTTSSVWSQQLSFMAEELKRSINKRLGEKIVKKIRFKS